jgi:hypothetical protein
MQQTSAHGWMILQPNAPQEGVFLLSVGLCHVAHDRHAHYAQQKTPSVLHGSTLFVFVCLREEWSLWRAQAHAL